MHITRDKEKALFPHMLRLLGSKVFSLFDTDDSLIDENIASNLRTEKSRRDFERAVDKLRYHNSEIEKVKLDNGEEIQITLK